MNSSENRKEPINCWEFMKEKGDAEKCQSCVVKTTTAASGFLQGSNGGRACMFISNTNCGNEKGMSIPEKIAKICSSCDFYKRLKTNHNGKLNYFDFRMHLK